MNYLIHEGRRMDDFQKGIALMSVGMMVVFLGIPVLLLVGDMAAIWTLLFGVFVFVVGIAFMIYETLEKR